MSILRYKYLNQFDTGTVMRFSSEETNLPAVNVQNGILGKVWQTEAGFVITPYNNRFSYQESSTTTVTSFAIPSATYTGSGLASKLQSNLNSVGLYSGYLVTFSAVTNKFTIDSQRTSTGILSLRFDDPTHSATTVGVIAGWEHGTAYTGGFSYTSPTDTVGGEHEIIISLTSTQTVSCFIIDNHDFDSATVIRLRGTQESGTVFNGGWNLTSSITLSSTISWNAGIISVEPAAAAYKALQLYWYDRKSSFNQIGRLWVGSFFEPNYHQTNTISFKQKEWDHRTKVFLSDSGAGYFDKRDRVDTYRLEVDPLDEFFDSVTKDGYEAFLADVGNDKYFYISFDHNLNDTTVYGYMIGKTTFKRLRYTTIFNVKDLVFREQK